MYKNALNHFKKTDPILFEAASKIKVIELQVYKDPFVRLTRSIVGQQLSVKAAATIYGRFEALLKNQITPQKILKTSDEKLRGVGLSFQKIKYLKDLSEKVKSKEINLNNLESLPDEEISIQLIKVKGIGLWTIEMFLMFHLGRPDIFSNGDLGLRNAIQKLYKLKNKPTEKQLLKITKKWSPFRTYASMILWRSLDNQPK
ncbi:MAG: DNA-3-methyladenine glycosylase 2 family protein [Candidatus Levybacteria bacterium CG10_big_fil_rev_8_21_14_0_10_36_7]|nr:MAG: DNA-3-methyladenine glycosylase 2 family protein [Candidatus Levybacteria bacterium CG10_big_fil_rev_8_21_14_0_10_36_7]